MVDIQLIELSAPHVQRQGGSIRKLIAAIRYYIAYASREAFRHGEHQRADYRHRLKDRATTSNAAEAVFYRQ
jgi:hypothetical protein